MAATSTLSRLSGRPAAALRRTLATSPALVPCLLAVVVFIALGASEAGFYPISTEEQPGLGWYPAGFLLLALLGTAVVAAGPPPRPTRFVAIALALLAGYTLWSFLSIAWAEQQGVAWDGANRTALYLVAFALFALWPTAPRGAVILVGAFGLGVAGLGLVELLKADASTQPELYFTDGRLAEPAGYINANVALWTLGVFPCVYLASSRAIHPVVRGAGLAGTLVLISLALMGQSRGWVFAIPLSVIAYVLVAPGRARALAAVGAVAAGALAVSAPVLAVHDEVAPGQLDGLLADATSRILVVAGILLLVGVAWGLVDRRVRPSERQTQLLNRAAVAALVLVLGVGAVAFVAKAGNPVSEVSEAWEKFKRGGRAGYAGEARLTSVETNRYDFWRVAWDRFRDRPVWGIGSENFQQDYLVAGTADEQPRYPHSLQLGVLSQTGLVGGLLLAGALLAAGWSAARVRLRGPPEAAAVAAVAGATFFYWLLHASVDWFWEFLGLTAPALALLALAGGAGVPAGREVRARLPRLTAPITAAVAGIALTISLAAPWLAERQIEQAVRGWTSSPAAAYDKLELAGRINPLSPKPNLTAALIAVRSEDHARAADELREVLRKEPRTSFALAELAAFASERGDHRGAEALLERARSLSPRDEVVLDALKRVQDGQTVGVDQLNDRYLEIVSRFKRE